MIGSLSVAAGAGKRSRMAKLKHTLILPWYSNIYAFSIFLYSGWIVVGMVYYRLINGWQWSTSFFFTLQVGFSVGFCAPVGTS